MNEVAISTQLDDNPPDCCRVVRSSYLSTTKGTKMNTVRSLILASLIISTVAFSQWTQQTSPTTGYFFEIRFLNSQVGLAVGGGGTLARTTDGGSLWSNVSATTQNLNGIVYLDTTKVWLAGDNATILVSTDLGASWSEEYYYNYLTYANYHELALVRSGTTSKIYVVGGNASYNLTAIGSSSGDGAWSPQVSGYAGRLTDVWFLNDSTGLATGDDGIILKTTNRGLWWNQKVSGTDTNLASVAFFDSLAGIIVGTSGQILRTTDAGETWTRVERAGNEMFFKVTVVNDSVAYACGSNSTIIRSSDQGQTWIAQSVSAPSGTVFEGISFVSETEGWATGSGGVIVHTSNGGLTATEGRVTGSSYTFGLDKNYPNPFNPQTTVNFTLAKQGHATLVVYDVLGKEVATLVDGELSGGRHTATFDGSRLSSGAYFLRLTSGSSVETIKAILEK